MRIRRLSPSISSIGRAVVASDTRIVRATARGAIPGTKGNASHRNGTCRPKTPSAHRVRVCPIRCGSRVDTTKTHGARSMRSRKRVNGKAAAKTSAAPTAAHTLRRATGSQPPSNPSHGGGQGPKRGRGAPYCQGFPPQSVQHDGGQGQGSSPTAPGRDLSSSSSPGSPASPITAFADTTGAAENRLPTRITALPLVSTGGHRGPLKNDLPAARDAAPPFLQIALVRRHLPGPARVARHGELD